MLDVKIVADRFNQETVKMQHSLLFGWCSFQYSETRIALHVLSTQYSL